MAKNKKRWLLLFVIGLGGGIIYILPYLQYSFYDVMLADFGISNEQMGNLMSVYGLLNLLGYLFGGIVADRISYKALIPISLVLTGVLGFWFAASPSYTELMIIHVLWAVTTVLTYFPAMTKAVKQLGADEEQGRIFGLKEAGFSLLAFIFSSVGIAIFTAAGDDINALLIFYSILYVVIGVLSWIFLPKDENVVHGKQKRDSGDSLWMGIKAVLKQPGFWLLGFMMFCAYALTVSAARMVPYLTSNFAVAAGIAAFIGSVRTYGIQYIGNIGGGFVVDKLGSAVSTMKYNFLICAALLLVLILIPAEQSLLYLVITVVLLASLFIQAFRGIYWASLPLLDIPEKYMGTAIGMLGVMAYVPDAFILTIYGKILDANVDAVEAGYKYIFGIMIGLALVGFILAFIFDKTNKKKKVVKSTGKQDDIAQPARS